MLKSPNWPVAKIRCIPDTAVFGLRSLYLSKNHVSYGWAPLEYIQLYIYISIYDWCSKIPHKLWSLVYRQSQLFYSTQSIKFYKMIAKRLFNWSLKYIISIMIIQKNDIIWCKIKYPPNAFKLCKKRRFIPIHSLISLLSIIYLYIELHFLFYIIK